MQDPEDNEKEIKVSDVKSEKVTVKTLMSEGQEHLFDEDTNCLTKFLAGDFNFFV